MLLQLGPKDLTLFEPCVVCLSVCLSTCLYVGLSTQLNNYL